MSQNNKKDNLFEEVQKIKRSIKKNYSIHDIFTPFLHFFLGITMVTCIQEFWAHWKNPLPFFFEGLCKFQSILLFVLFSVAVMINLIHMFHSYQCTLVNPTYIKMNIDFKWSENLINFLLIICFLTVSFFMILCYANNLMCFSILYATSTLMAIMWDIFTILKLWKLEFNSANNMLWKVAISWIKLDSILFGGSVVLVIGVLYSSHFILFLFSTGLIALIVIDYRNNHNFFFPWKIEKAI